MCLRNVLNSMSWRISELTVLEMPIPYGMKELYTICHMPWRCSVPYISWSSVPYVLEMSCTMYILEKLYTICPGDYHVYIGEALYYLPWRFSVTCISLRSCVPLCPVDVLYHVHLEEALYHTSWRGSVPYTSWRSSVPYVLENICSQTRTWGSSKDRKK